MAEGKEMAHRKQLGVAVRAVIRGLLKRRLCMVVAQRVLVLCQGASGEKQDDARQAQRMVCGVLRGKETVAGEVDEPPPAPNGMGLLASWRQGQQVLLLQVG